MNKKEDEIYYPECGKAIKKKDFMKIILRDSK